MDFRIFLSGNPVLNHIKIMVNNLSLIEPLLEFPDEDSFYFLQILQRKKDRKEIDGKVVGSNNSSRLIRGYNITSLEYLQNRIPEIIRLCDLFNARAVIGLNRRSFKFCSAEMLVQMARKIQCGHHNHSSLWNNVCGVYYPNKDKRWILDIDSDDFDKIRYARQFISSAQPTGDKLIAVLPSKSGFHLIVKPFDSRSFVAEFPDIEIHKNNPTNLYIP